MTTYKIKQIDAFTNRAFGGNPAGVVMSADGLKDGEMQNIAKEMNLSETAFILKSNKADFRIRWFTPKKEVLFCGHATVASLHALAEEGMFGMSSNGIFDLKTETMVGIITVKVEKSEKSIQVFLSSPKINFIKEQVDIKSLTKALQINNKDIVDTLPIMREKTLDYLYVPIKSLETLKTISYDYKKLENFGNKLGIKGFTLFTTSTFEKSSDVHSRFFTPFYGVYEDPVTGSSQGPLGVYFVQNSLVRFDGNMTTIESEQGDIMGRPGRLTIQITKELDGSFSAVLISSAVTVLEGQFVLP
ncbi:MAG: PhzF family phenazine biosynthesis protein [Candidatus Jacksonbacteria bacterium]